MSRIAKIVISKLKTSPIISSISLKLFEDKVHIDGVDGRHSDVKKDLPISFMLLIPTRGDYSTFLAKNTFGFC